MTATLPWLIWAVLGAVDAGTTSAAAAVGAGPGAAGTVEADAGPAAVPPAPKKKPVAPPPRVEIACEPEPVRVGEPLLCTLTALHVEAVSLTVPTPPGAEDHTSFDVEGARAAEKADSGLLRTVRRFAIVQYGLDEIRVPDINVVWRDTTGGEDVLRVPGRSVGLTRLTDNQTDLDFKTFAKLPEAPEAIDAFWLAYGPVPFLVTNWPLLIAVIVLIGGAIGFGLGWIVYRWIAARRAAREPVVDVRPAHIIAYELLAKLESERLPETGETKLFYFRLSEIVRDYLERRFDFLALEMTSDEIRGQARARDDIGAEAELAIEDFLFETDLVKFADFNPSDSAVETVFRAGRGIVELTRVPDATEAANAAPTSSAGGTTEAAS